MDDITKGNLNHKVQEASLLRDWCRHEGFKIWKSDLESKIEDLKNEWFKADDEQGKKIKLRAQVYNEVLDSIKKKIIEGDNAALMLHNSDSASAE
jgi:hypothetical protein